MIFLILVWVGLVAWCLALSWRGRPGTLLLAYFFGLSLIHVPGAINHLGETSLVGDAETRIGFAATLMGMAAMLTGVTLFRLKRGYIPSIIGPRPPQSVQAIAAIQFSKLGQRLLIAGACSYFLVLPFTAIIPSLTAIISAFGGLLVIGYWVWLSGAAARKGRQEIRRILLSLPLLPLLTLVAGGFAGFGIYFVLAILAYYFEVSRLRWTAVLFAPIVAWLGLSLGVAYLSERDQIREAVWYQNANFDDRVKRVFDVFDKFELYDWNNERHTYNVDLRLNQNFLFGIGINRVESGQVALAQGSTLPLWSIIPRALWPGKPEVGGGGDIVSRYTGFYFPPGTSVGVGQPMEFYINFGWIGLVVGFLCWGVLLAHMDEGLASGLRSFDIKKVLFYGLPGITLLNAGGNFLEILIAFIAAILAARIALAGLMKLDLVPRFSSMSRRVEGRARLD